MQFLVRQEDKCTREKTLAGTDRLIIDNANESRVLYCLRMSIIKEYEVRQA